MTFAKKMKCSSAIRHLLKSAMIALILPSIFWFAFSLKNGEIGSLIFLFLALVISIPVHFLGHLILGFLPFYFFFDRSDYFIWRLPISVLLGVFLASLGLFIWGGLAKGGFSNFGIDQDFTLLSLLYGFSSGVAAWLCRPQIANKTMHPTESS
jgi:hypothetical protein